MVRVGFQEALYYGFSLILYSVFVIISSGLFFFVGSIIAGGGFYVLANNPEDHDGVFTASILLAFFFGFMGYLTLIAGFSGMLYKVIADAVHRGQSMKHSVASTTVSPPPGLPTATTIPKVVTKSARYDDFEY
jgi:hypothetical protein